MTTKLASRLAGQFQELPQGTAEEMWDFFKTTTLSTASGVLGIRKCTRRSFVSNDTLDLIDKSLRAGLDSFGNVQISDLDFADDTLGMMIRWRC